MTTVEHEVLTWDNGSSDETPKELRRFSDGYILSSQNVGVAPAWRELVKLAKYPYICLLNNDTEIQTFGWLRTMIGEMTDRTGVVCPTVSWGAPMQMTGKEWVGCTYADRYPYAVCWLIRRSVYDEVGGIEHPGRGIAGADDADFAFKLYREGYSVRVTPNVFLWHYGGASSHRGPERERWLKEWQTTGKAFNEKWQKELSSEEKQPLITVTVLSCGRLDYLKRTMESFFRATDYLNFETVVVDNGSNEELVRWLLDQPWLDVLVHNRENEGIGYAMNQANKEVRGQYVLHLEDDWEFVSVEGERRRWIEDAMEILDTFSDIGQVRFRIRPEGQYGQFNLTVAETRETPGGVGCRVLKVADRDGGIWGGYTNNPSLMRSSYIEEFPEFELQNQENRFAAIFNRKYRSSKLREDMCHHIGEESAFTEESARRFATPHVGRRQ